ncbi:hypothetical protein [Neorhodopirellula lusitana]|uniref:hypothetical protein n=1 Tax=Neorhodopirellula lusitana TaxID=445327 RepID=UPI00384C48DD
MAVASNRSEFRTYCGWKPRSRKDTEIETGNTRATNFGTCIRKKMPTADTDAEASVTGEFVLQVSTRK